MNFGIPTRPRSLLTSNNATSPTLAMLVQLAGFGGETATGGIIENYPGHTDIDGFELMTLFRAQVEKYEVPTVEDRVTNISRGGSLLRTRNLCRKRVPGTGCDSGSRKREEKARPGA